MSVPFEYFTSWVTRLQRYYDSKTYYRGVFDSVISKWLIHFHKEMLADRKRLSGLVT